MPKPQTIKKTLNLTARDRIVAVRPEYASGPGWSNMPIWVYVRREDGRITEECIQPNELKPTMSILFATCEAAASAMISQVEKEARRA